MLQRYYAAGKPMLAFSPGGTQFVVAGERDRPAEFDPASGCSALRTSMPTLPAESWARDAGRMDASRLICGVTHIGPLGGPALQGF